MRVDISRLEILRTVFSVVIAIVFTVGASFPLQAASKDVAYSNLLGSENQRVSQLINQLGDPDYHLRRRAEEELLRLGKDVFDQLQEVEDHSDLEIASRATYILQKIDIQWVRPADSEEVRLLLHRYAGLSVEQRRERMEELFSLDSHAGLAALSRIARFEPSLQLARYAALQVLDAEVSAADIQQLSSDVIEELGNSRRAPVLWIRAFINELQESQTDFVHRLALIDHDMELLQEDSRNTDKQLVLGLINLSLKQVEEETTAELAGELLKRRIDVSAQGSGELQAELYQAFSWIWKQQRWDVSELLEDQYAEQILSDRMASYFVALVRWRQGKDSDAEHAADQAFRLNADDTIQRSNFGNVLGECGRHDWAEREWIYAIEQLPVLQTADARRSLAIFRYQDRGEHKQAADLLVELCEAIEGDKRLKPQIKRNDLLKLYFSQRDYLLACQAADEGDFKLQRKLLESAYGYEDLDADLLIAMYRSPEADEAYRRQTVERIRSAAEKLEKFIAEDPDNAQTYNHWAWLIGNTVGDYQQAVRRSQRSLELSPDNPSYLDTLGRCYFAAGEVEKAIEVQRKAIRLHPHLRVMRTQLETFEKQLAERG